MRSLARLLAGGVAIACYAAAALGSGLDRMSEARPEMAVATPEVFHTFAARRLAFDDLRRNRPDSAVSHAQRAVQRDPLDAQSSGLLGAALLAAGKNDSARAAFTVAGALGWREPLTQSYWMGVALEQGDLRIAAQRLDAILRQAPQYEGRQQMVALFEASPEGREQLVERLADAPVWRGSYFQDVHQLSPLNRKLRAEVALRLSEDAKVRDCSLVSGLSSVLTNEADFALGHRVWRAHCLPPGQQGFVNNGGFEFSGLVRPKNAFDWVWTEDGAVELGLGQVPGFFGQALSLTNRAPGYRVGATQLMALAPGRYRVSWRARNVSGQPGTGISVSVACDPNALATLPAVPVNTRTEQFSAQFNITAGCSGQWLKLGIAEGGESVTVDDLVVVSLDGRTQ
jgi:hypothetical protein